MDSINFSSRLDVTGGPVTNCSRCDRMSLIPVKNDTKDPLLALLWVLAEARTQGGELDDFHLVPCPQCNGEDRDMVLAKRTLSTIRTEFQRSTLLTGQNGTL